MAAACLCNDPSVRQHIHSIHSLPTQGDYSPRKPSRSRQGIFLGFQITSLPTIAYETLELAASVHVPSPLWCHGSSLTESRSCWDRHYLLDAIRPVLILKDGPALKMGTYLSARTEGDLCKGSVCWACDFLLALSCRASGEQKVMSNNPGFPSTQLCPEFRLCHIVSSASFCCARLAIVPRH